MLHIAGGIILAVLILRNLDAIIVLAALAFTAIIALIGLAIVVGFTTAYAIYLPGQLIIFVSSVSGVLGLMLWLTNDKPRRRRHPAFARFYVRAFDRDPDAHPVRLCCWRVAQITLIVYLLLMSVYNPDQLGWAVLAFALSIPLGLGLRCSVLRVRARGFESWALSRTVQQRRRQQWHAQWQAQRDAQIAWGEQLLAAEAESYARSEADYRAKVNARLAWAEIRALRATGIRDYKDLANGLNEAGIGGRWNEARIESLLELN